ncbi:integrase family protein [Natronococcus jeotgali DSM 18795]|uniref:Integrase family protein n=2 Tax=Natronococcus jeotgali TaxID=413812 RepID=L9XLU5_9EURY|nr:integrase family protein [Natronococcus jeotgali DSM 18795]
MVSRYLERSIKSDGSKATMRPALERFTSFCQREEIDEIRELEAGDLREFGYTLREDQVDGKIAASTANTYFAYVRSFLSFCVREELLDANPAKTNKATEYLPEDTSDSSSQFWTPEQRQVIVNYATKRVDMANDGTIRTDPLTASRDRTIVVLLAETGARGAELFDDSKDEKRNGVTWGDVNLEKHVLSVFGKSRNREEVPLPKAARDVLERHRKYVAPPTDEWPVFPTGHFQSKRGVLQVELGEDQLSKALEERGDASKTDVLDDLLRKYEIAPPSISKEGARRVMKRLTDEANIELEDRHEYLKPHGARRGLGAELYALGESEKAQQVLRHKSIETTHEAYSDLKTKDLAQSIDEIRRR